MSWAVGWDQFWNRDIGYGVPSICDHKGCKTEINRGLAYVCCDQTPYGGDRGCGLYFCENHSDSRGRCTRCRGRPRRPPHVPTPDLVEWIRHKLFDPSWGKWRAVNGLEVAKLYASLPMIAGPEPEYCCSDGERLGLNGIVCPECLKYYNSWGEP